ncbi:MAG TPA: AraC family transcriptional regulator [Arachidicoccus sp.]|nr:AraC family transcriptional regulator [Arachidicoccus sp.]
MEIFETHTKRHDPIVWDHLPLQPAIHKGLILPDAANTNLSGGFGNLSFQGLISDDGYAIWANHYKMLQTRTFITEALSTAFELNVMLSNIAEHTLFDHIHQSIAAQQYNLFFLPYIKNEITLYGNQLYDTLDFHFELGYFERLVSHYPDIIGPMLDKAYRGEGVSFSPAATFLNEELRFLGRHIVRLVTQKLSDKYYLDLAVRLFLISVLLNRDPSHCGLLIEPEDETNLIAAHEKLMGDLSQFTSIAELSRIACMNTTKFKQIFKKKYTLSPMRYWNEFRMNDALELLIHTDKSIKDVSDKLGFQDLSSFSRAFSRKYTITPSEVIKRSR